MRDWQHERPDGSSSLILKSPIYLSAWGKGKISGTLHRLLRAGIGTSPPKRLLSQGTSPPQDTRPTKAPAQQNTYQCLLPHLAPATPKGSFR